MRSIELSVKCLVIAVVFGLMPAIARQAAAKPLKVFILAGQSNMQGHANISTFDSMADDPKTAPILKEMRNADGAPRVCEKVWISSIGCRGDRYSDLTEQTGQLTAGFGASPQEIGPEFTFGIYMEKMLGEPILIIKTSWGGRSLHTDFRPPGPGLRPSTTSSWASGKREGLDVEQESAKIRKSDGVFYREMIQHVRKVLGDIKRVDPQYDPGQGYELAGFVWFQGFNDMIDSGTYPDRMKPGGYDLYGQLLAQFIRDVRKDLSAPTMPFVIGVMGIDGLQARPASIVLSQGSGRAGVTSWVPGQRACGADCPLLGRRFGRAANTAGETRIEGQRRVQEGSETDSRGQRGDSRKGHRWKLHARGNQTPQGHLQRRLPLSRRRQNYGADRKGFCRSNG